MTITDDIVPVQGVRTRDPDDRVPRPAGSSGEPLLDAMRAVLRGITSLSPLPVGRQRLLWFFRRPAGFGVADAYVCVWVAILTGGLAVADGDLGPIAAGFAVFRYGDLVTALATVLVDPIGLRVGDARRQLVLVGLHVVELVLVVSTIFRWIIGERFGSALMTGLDVVTFQWPVRHPGNWIEAARAMAVGGVLLLTVVTIASAARIGRDR